MKKLLAALVAIVFVTSIARPAFAADAVTITGTALCAKCELHETDKCQTAIRTKEDGKDVVYYAANNDVAKQFHKNVCTAPAQVTATGTVKEKDGKKTITLTKIELK